MNRQSSSETEQPRTSKDYHIASQPDSTSRSASPRRLIKQVALESPPPIQWDSVDPFHEFSTDNDRKSMSPSSEKLTHLGNFILLGHLAAKAESFPRPKGKKSNYTLGPSKLETFYDNQSENLTYSTIDLKNTCFRIGDETVIDRCAECGTITESYSDEDLGLCIIILGTFIHREPALAAPLLPDILSIVAKYVNLQFWPFLFTTFFMNFSE